MVIVVQLARCVACTVLV